MSSKKALRLLGYQRLHIDDLGFYHLFVLPGKPSTYVFLQVFTHFLNFITRTIILRLSGAKIPIL